MQFHVFLHDPDSARTLRAISTLSEKVQTMFEDLQAQVQAITDADAAQRLVLADIKKKLDDIRATSTLAPADAAKLASLSAALGAEAAAVVAATLANTDAAPTP